MTAGLWDAGPVAKAAACPRQPQIDPTADGADRTALPEVRMMPGPEKPRMAPTEAPKSLVALAAFGRSLVVAHQYDP